MVRFSLGRPVHQPKRGSPQASLPVLCGGTALATPRIGGVLLNSNGDLVLWASELRSPGDHGHHGPWVVGAHSVGLLEARG